MTDPLIQVLEKSIQNHGPNKVVTLGHLLNIVKMAERIKVQQIEQQDREEYEIHAESLGEIE